MEPSHRLLPRALFLAAVLWLQTIPAGFAAGDQAASKPTGGRLSDPGWPREFIRNGVRLAYYQPQVDDWKDFRELQARAAFTLTPSDGKTAVGVEELRGRTTVDLEHRTVLIDNIEIVAVRFPSLPAAEAAAMDNLLRSTFPGKAITVSLDRLIASVQAGHENARPVAVKTDPPQIFVSTEPAILLTVPGKPVLAPIKGLGLQFVLNANWDLFFDPADSRYYLLVDKLWLMAQALDESWVPAKRLPADLSRLPDDESWDHVKKAAAAGAAQSAKAPKVFFTTEPAELIVFAGPPVYKAINGTRLLYATNTDSWVFTDSGNDRIYFLVTGRWFRAPKLEGPWTYAGDDLPDDFKQIPPDSGAANVLASVPGTPESEDAVLLAQVPVSAVVNRAQAESKAGVGYNGEPNFAPIEGTPLSYATNANADVIRVKDKYYLCENAVWFVSSSPTGPWTIATTVPEAIYTIPPSNPVYRVTYVKVEGSTNPNEVVCSYTAGYYGAYVAGMAAGAALVWGTGYYYPPYVYPGPVPVYRPYYATYGVSAAYYPNRGVYGVGGYAYGPYASAGRAAWYNPSTGAYGRAYTEQYPYGGRTSAWGYNPSTDTSWTTQQGHGYYAQWGSSTVTRGDQTVQTGHVVTNYGSSSVAKGPNNLYAGHDGNVYRRDDNGNWSKWDNGQWQPVNASGAAHNRTPNQSGNLTSSQPGGSHAREPATQGGTNPSQRNGSSDLGASSQGGRSQTGQRAAEQPAQRSAEKSRQTEGQRGSQAGEAGRRTEARQPSNDVLNGLNREASARQRGSQGVNLQERSAGRERRGGRPSNERGSRRSEGRGRFRE